MSPNPPPPPQGFQPNPDGSYPYPPQPAVNAPGGYPATAAGAPPASSNPAYPPAYPPNMEPPVKGQQQQQQHQYPPPAGYPGAAPMPQGAPYPPPAGHYPPPAPAPGYPVQHAPVAGTVGGMQVVQAAGQPGDERCGCSMGWVFFGLGLIFTPFLFGALVIPLCTKNRNDKRAAIASAIALVVCVVLAVILAVTSPRYARSTRGW